MELRDCRYRELYCAGCKCDFGTRCAPVLLPCYHVVCGKCGKRANFCILCGDISRFLPIPHNSQLLQNIQILGDLYLRIKRPFLSPDRLFTSTQQIFLYLNEVPEEWNADLDCRYGEKCRVRGCVYAHGGRKSGVENPQLEQLVGDSIPPSIRSTLRQPTHSVSGTRCDQINPVCSRCGEGVTKELPFCVSCGLPTGQIVCGRTLLPPDS